MQQILGTNQVEIETDNIQILEEGKAFELGKLLRFTPFHDDLVAVVPPHLLLRSSMVQVLT